MHSMQYEITLPADYDMGRIRHRVATRGRALDGLSGLDFKAYLIRERQVAGSSVHQYAPYYLWHDPNALTGFLRGPGFRGLCQDFGRPAVRTGVGLARLTGPAGRTAAVPRAAARHTVAISGDADASTAIDEAERALRKLPQRAPGLHTALLALDPQRWELARFTLWAEDVDAVPEDQPGERYQVLHLSEGAR